jgi:hypothetical protein
MRKATVTTNDQGRGRTSHPRSLRLLCRIGIVAVLVPAGACAGLPGARSSAPASVRLKGTGDTASTRVALPANWTAAWHFSCRGADQGQPFALVATGQGKSRRSFDVIRQTGLSGGGQQQYKAAGEYVFKVTTPCDWTLDAGRSVIDGKAHAAPSH